MDTLCAVSQSRKAVQSWDLHHCDQCEESFHIIIMIYVFWDRLDLDPKSNKKRGLYIDRGFYQIRSKSNLYNIRMVQVPASYDLLILQYTNITLLTFQCQVCINW